MTNSSIDTNKVDPAIRDLRGSKLDFYKGVLFFKT